MRREEEENGEGKKDMERRREDYTQTPHIELSFFFNSKEANLLLDRQNVCLMVPG